MEKNGELAVSGTRRETAGDDHGIVAIFIIDELLLSGNIEIYHENCQNCRD